MAQRHKLRRHEPGRIVEDIGAMRRQITEEISEKIDEFEIRVTRETIEGPHIAVSDKIMITRGSGCNGLSALWISGNTREVASTFRRIAEWLESIE